MITAKVGGATYVRDDMGEWKGPSEIVRDFLRDLCASRMLDYSPPESDPEGFLVRYFNAEFPSLEAEWVDPPPTNVRRQRGVVM